MQQKLTPKETYTHYLELYTSTLKKLKKKRSNIGWLRLLIVLAVLFLIYSMFFKLSAVAVALVVVGIATFLHVISIDAGNNEKIAETERLVEINKGELSTLSGNYSNRDDGASFMPAQHPYAGDIDLFGKASLYQYLNRCTSQQSTQLLATALLQPAPPGVIIDRQEAAQSLSNNVEWRQKLQSSGMADSLTFQTENKIKAWLQMAEPLQQSFWKIIPPLFTTITLFTVAAFLLDWISSAVFWMLVFVYFLVAKYTSGKVIETYTALTKVEGEIETIYKQLQLIEELPAVNGKLLNSYKRILVTEKKGTDGIKSLKEILKKFDFRLNLLVFMVLNTFFLWDVRQTLHLNKWKKEFASSVPAWFEILANIELVSTLATLTFNHPDWIFPTVVHDHLTLSGEQMGHPLIKENKRVNNSFSTTGTGKISIITGSNMAGKSTFLRSIAISLVLAQSGAPVCAAAFTFSPVRLYSSMRISDNLAENTSTFYAELKKLKSIIEQVKQHERVFILLDEILRGTNSLDRHTGSEALIRQLIRDQAVAVIATHDVELGNLQNEFKEEIDNYHFDVQVEGEELYFDYKLKRGICQSLNAFLLMKKIGIEI
ncbi:MAG: hypothetical protein M3040_03175 [Bacteroidota bacterium]|nr:hypothetical protein [Bacteroidota bacterium]